MLFLEGKAIGAIAMQLLPPCRGDRYKLVGSRMMSDTVHEVAP